MSVLTGPINFPYTAIQLTSRVDRVPNLYGRLQEMDLFPGEGVTTTMVEVAMRDGYITILGAEARDGDVPVGKADEEGSIFLKIPHIPHLEKLTPADLQDKYEIVGGQRVPRGMESALSRKMVKIRWNHAITLEFLRMGALKGLIVDGKNKTLYDLYQVFGITKKTVSFGLSDDTTNVLDKTFEVARHMEENLRGEIMNGVRALVSPEFFTLLTGHPNVEKYYLNYREGAEKKGGDVRKSFPFGAITFEEYNATGTDLTGATRKFIAAGKGHAFPVGTMEAFKTHFAPPNHVSFANMVGPEVFVSPEILKHGAGVELKSESNPLPVCRRPEMLVELTV